MGTRLAIGAVVFVLLAAALAVVFAKPVIGWYRQRTADAEATTEHATDDAEGRKLEVTGTEELTTAAGELSAAVGQLRGSAYALDRRSRADPAARTTLPPSVVARLREHDRSLCADSVVRCDDLPAAATGRAGLRPGEVHALDVAGE